jgi:hypothetical protein
MECLCRRNSLVVGRGPYAGARFCIMKGTVPTDFSTLTNFNVRAADVLITFDTTPAMSSTGNNLFLPSQDAANPIIISTTYKNATASGVATWYWWTVRKVFSLLDTDPFCHQIIGTIGIVGSGADLEISDVNLVSGNAYRVYNLRLNWPTTWTF